MKNESSQIIESRDQRDFVIESMTFQQQQYEEQDIICNESEDNQTVINCTQSDVQSSEYDQYEERISDKNVAADEFSLEYDGQKIDTGLDDQIVEADMRPEQDYATEQQVFSYHEGDSEMEEGEYEDDYLSRVEYQIDTQPQEIYTEEDYQEEELIDQVQEDNASEDKPDSKQRKEFESTLTNMRIAFGSEQQVRENSVKTLEKMGGSAEKSSSGHKTDEQSSIFEKKSFQNFSLKKFTELMQVKNMESFQNSMQKTFREYDKTQIVSIKEKIDRERKVS